MKFHSSLKPALWGAVAGAAAISVIGFSSMGSTLRPEFSLSRGIARRRSIEGFER